MKNLLMSNYIILWLHLLNLTFRMFDELKDFEIFKLDMDNFNLFLNNLFSVNYVFDDGVINIFTFITAIISIYLGKFYDNLIFLIFFTLLIELVIIYNNKNGKLLISILIMTFFYLIGKLIMKSDNKYKLEKNFDETIFIDSNIQEYEPYKLY